MRFRSRLAAAVAVASTLLAASLASAPAASAASGTGWVRVAHLSPDTKHVDVRVVALSGSDRVVQVKDVAYGAVSKYYALPAGEFALAMRPAGAPVDATPVIQASMRVTAGTASTVAVFGKNAELKMKVVQDDLAAPAAGRARVRLVQASTSSDPVTVKSSDGTVVASDAALASVSKYASTPVGAWKLQARQGTATSQSSVTLKSGQVVSLFVLDTANGSITVRPVVDSSGAGPAPKGFVATGGGYLAHRAEETSRIGTVGAGAAIAVALGIGVPLALRRRRAARA